MLTGSCLSSRWEERQSMRPCMRPWRANAWRASMVRRSLADARPPRLDDTAALAPHIKAARIGVGHELLRLSDDGFACAQQQYGVGCARRGELVKHGTEIGRAHV